MLRLIPWDVWIAAALAVGVTLAAIFDPAPVIFIAVYLGLCAYIILETVSGELH
ncbi:MAG TPA: hypothetical protein VH558_01330 [Pseudolabrys sp.]|jgi:hypothetical protein